MTTHDDSPDNEHRPPELPLQAQVVDAEEPIETHEDSGSFITEPSKLIRIASMTRAMLEEVRQADLDEPGRRRLGEIYTNSLANSHTNTFANIHACSNSYRFIECE